MSDSPVGLVVAVVLLVGATAGAGALAGDPARQVGVQTDSTTLSVDLQADGDATWEVRYRVELDDQNTTDAFANLSDDIERNPETYLSPFEQRMARTVNASENATRREMTVRNVSVETRRESQPQTEYGLLVYRLEWTNFAAVEGESIRAGDAIDQFFLDSETILRVTWPEEYSLSETTPAPTRNSTGEAVWEGRQDFDPGEPRIVLDPANGTNGTESPDDTESGGLPLVGIFAVLVVALAVSGWLFARDRDLSSPFAESDEDDAASGHDADADDAGADAESDETATPPPELLSNEEQVLQLLEANGGRMKQKAVAEELDWTAAKTSQVISDLRDEEKLDSFRLGRENVLTLPDVDIDGEE